MDQLFNNNEPHKAPRHLLILPWKKTMPKMTFSGDGGMYLLEDIPGYFFGD